MSVWTDLDALVSKHKAQIAELVALAKEGRRYRKPRFVPPCVWVLRVRSAAPPPRETLTFTTYEEAHAELKRVAGETISKRLAREQAKADAKKARRKR